MRCVQTLLVVLLLALAATGTAEATGPVHCPNGMEAR